MFGIEKIIDIPEYFYNTDEPSVQVLSTEEKGELVKEASEDLKKLIPEKYLNGKYLVLKVVALGAGEYYGANTNADYFPEEELKKFYKTFETDAKVYLFHKKDKSYGDVILSEYNDNMHRVELIVAIDKDKVPKEILDRFEELHTVPFSMGCRVLKDICSICGNERNVFNPSHNACVHRKLDLGKVYPDGRKMFLINKSPTFIDISIVRVPADKTAYPLLKVAEEQEPEVVKIKPDLKSLPKPEELSLDNIIKYVARVLNLDLDLVEKHKDEIIKGVKDAMVFLASHPEDYKTALHLLGIEPYLEKKASQMVLGNPISPRFINVNKDDKGTAKNILGLTLTTLLSGAISLWLLKKIMLGDGNESKRFEDYIKPKLNYGNGIIIEKDPNGHYFIASNTNILG